jgi:hypothetical protein
VLGLARHRGHQRDRGGARADDDDLLAGVVEVLGPELRVHDLALKPLGTGELRCVPGLVVVVARAAPQQAAGDRPGLRLAAGRACRDLDGHGPALVAGVPGRRDDLVAVADQSVDAVLLRDGAQVVEDQRTVGQRGVAGPGTPAVAEGEHVGVRADAGVAEEVPRAAEALAGLQDRHAAARVAAAQLRGGTDAGQAGPHHQDVDVLGLGLAHGETVAESRAY